MVTTNTLKIALIGIVLSLPLVVQASQVFVEKTTGSDLTEGELNTVTSLIKTSVPESGADQIVESSHEADFILRPSLIRLGQSYILNIAKVRSGKTVFSSKLKATKFDEMDKISLRLTRSVLSEERAGDKPRVGEVTDHESKEGSQRRPTHDRKYVAFGGSTLGQLNAPGVGYSLGLGYSWDLNTVALKLLLDGNLSGSALFMNVGAGINYYLTSTDFSPYVSGDFGLGWSKSDGGSLISGANSAGFVFGLGAGVEFFRTASVNLDIGLHASFMTVQNGIGLPAAFTLRAGLYF
jgi:hypothetical protein